VEEVQPGIESLSTPILRLMRKGTTALQNIQFLKWARAVGLRVVWNLLMGFPGEDPAEYSRMAEMVPALVHLQPPDGPARIRLDRFSPYFEEREALGVCNVQPADVYRYIYPFPEEDLEQLAYFFDYDYLDGRGPWAYVRPLAEALAAWQEKADASLTYTRSGETLLVRDARGPAVAWVRLRGPQCAVYEFCDQVHAFPVIEALAQRACAARGVASGRPEGRGGGTPGDEPAGACWQPEIKATLTCCAVRWKTSSRTERRLTEGCSCRAITVTRAVTNTTGHHSGTTTSRTLTPRGSPRSTCGRWTAGT